MRKYLLLLAIFFALISAISILFSVNPLRFVIGYWYEITNSRPLPPVATDLPITTGSEPDNLADFTASFAIFTNGTKRIFTAPMYHNRSADVYIASDSPSTVRVKKQNLNWNDFFKTLPFSLSKTCLTTGTGQVFCDGAGGRLRFFLNSSENPDALSEVIQPGSKLLVTFGNESSEGIASQMNEILTQ